MYSEIKYFKQIFLNLQIVKENNKKQISANCAILFTINTFTK